MFDLSGGAVIIVFALLTALGLLLVALLGRMPGVTRAVTRVFWCPFRAHNVAVEFQEEVWDGKPVALNRCSAFSPPTAVRCAKLCLGLKKFPVARKGTPLQGRGAELGMSGDPGWPSHKLAVRGGISQWGSRGARF